MTSAGAGLTLARTFYDQIVRPLLDTPESLPYSAALLGEGSEVLGYDDPRSTDHAWGPRLQVFVQAADVEAVQARLEAQLPEMFQGHPVRFYAWQDDTVRHHVEVSTIERWLHQQLQTTLDDLDTAGWLAMPQQQLLQVTAGAVFHDDGGVLSRVRERLSYYPHDVWLWLLASQWRAIADCEPLLGRTAEAGDERGSRLAASMMVRLSMQMCFLQQRRYWPYGKWFGTAFKRLNVPPALTAALDRLMDAADGASRQEALVEVEQSLARRHNGLEVSPALDPSCQPFEVGIAGATRPFLVLNATRFQTACVTALQDDRLRRLEAVGAVDQLTHSNDTLVNFTTWRHHLTATYRSMLTAQA